MGEGRGRPGGRARHLGTQASAGSRGRRLVAAAGPLVVAALLIGIAVVLSQDLPSSRLLQNRGTKGGSTAEDATVEGARDAAEPSAQDSATDAQDLAAHAAGPDPERSGWCEDEAGARFYYDPQTHELHRGWLELDGSRYWCDEASGQMRTGWLELDGRRYWFSDGSVGEPGVLLCDSWLVLDGKRYHLGVEGAADEGWVELDGLSYCFDAVGAMRTGWVTGEDGRQRYLKPEDGTMAAHEWVEVDGLWHPFDDDGAWVGSDDEIVPPDDAQHMATLTYRQQAVIDACDLTPWPGRALCAAWVSQVFACAGEPAVPGDACDLARAWCHSSELSELRPGMLVAVTTHSRTENGRIWGHVAIYVGDGLVRDSGTYGVRRIRLGEWLAWFGVDEAPRWGWANGIVLG